MTESVPYHLKSSDELRILREMVKLAGAPLDLGEVLHRVVGIIDDLVQPDSTFIYLVDGERGTLDLAASKVPHDDELGAIVLRPGEGITGWTAREGEPVYISRRAYDDPRFKQFEALPEDRFEAFMSLPVVYNERVVGVINVQHREAFRHTAKVKELLAAVAAMVGGVIEHARLFEENRVKAGRFDSLAQLSRTMTSEKYLDDILDLVAVITAEMLDSRICSIMLIDDKGSHLRIKAAQGLSDTLLKKPPVPLENSLSGDVIRSMEPRAVRRLADESRFVCQDMVRDEELESALLIPLIIRDKAIGIINVYTRTCRDFSREEVNALLIVAHQAAVVIENTDLMEEALRSREALQVRKLIERAKGLLMKMSGMDEPSAHRTIQLRSKESGRSMKEVAEAVILAAEMMPGR